MTMPVRLGLRANARQFALLVVLNALVGAETMTGRDGNTAIALLRA